MISEKELDDLQNKLKKELEDFEELFNRLQNCKDPEEYQKLDNQLKEMALKMSNSVTEEMVKEICR